MHPSGAEAWSVSLHRDASRLEWAWNRYPDICCSVDECKPTRNEAMRAALAASRPTTLTDKLDLLQSIGTLPVEERKAAIDLILTGKTAESELRPGWRVGAHDAETLWYRDMQASIQWKAQYGEWAVYCPPFSSTPDYRGDRDGAMRRAEDMAAERGGR